jgi:hypothetical protein
MSGPTGIVRKLLAIPGAIGHLLRASGHLSYGASHLLL